MWSMSVKEEKDDTEAVTGIISQPCQKLIYHK